jgi:hypothetical protein
MLRRKLANACRYYFAIPSIDSKVGGKDFRAEARSRSAGNDFSLLRAFTEQQMGRSIKTFLPKAVSLELTVEVRTGVGMYSPVPLLLEMTRMTSGGHKTRQ